MESGSDSGSEPGSARQPFVVRVSGGSIGGWVAGQGIPLVLLHGGPGLGFEYLDDLATELSASWVMCRASPRMQDWASGADRFTSSSALISGASKRA